MFAGYGFYPPTRELPAGNDIVSSIEDAEVDEFIRRCALNFRTQRELLEFAS